MGKLPPLELLDAIHKFPGPYTFKLIGIADDFFLPRVIAAIRDELHYETDPPYDVRESVGGRHIAVTVELVMNSSSQIHAVYQRLLSLPGLVVIF